MNSIQQIFFFQEHFYFYLNPEDTDCSFFKFQLLYWNRFFSHELISHTSFIVEFLTPHQVETNKFNLYDYPKEDSISKNLGRDMKNQGCVPNLPIM